MINCFAAVKPDAEWFGFFREGMERIAGPLEEFTKQGSNALTLQAARRIAQEESFGSSSIVRQLNMAEILSRAEQEQQRISAESEARVQEHIRVAEDNIASIRDRSEKDLIEASEAASLARTLAVREAVDLARREMIAALDEERRRAAFRRSGYVILALRGVLFMLLSSAICYVVVLQFGDESVSRTLVIVSVILAMANIVSIADMLKFSLIEDISSRFRNWIARRLRAG